MFQSLKSSHRTRWASTAHLGDTAPTLRQLGSNASPDHEAGAPLLLTLEGHMPGTYLTVPFKEKDLAKVLWGPLG